MKYAIIPARGGSKRIPKKNIKQFCGKPMIAWSIIAAQKSGCFDKIIISTDDNHIAKIAQEYGASVPFLRPKELSDDYTGTTAVIKHAAQWLLSSGKKPQEICCIYATAPFIQANDIQEGLRILQSKHCDYAFSVTSYPFPIQRAIRITEDQHVEMFNPELFTTRSQDLEESFHDAGQFYWGHIDSWLNEHPIFSNNSSPVLLPRYRVQDIDTPEDWLRAEWMFKAQSKV